MKSIRLAMFGRVCFALLLLVACKTQAQADAANLPQTAVLHTSKGDITIKLLPKQAPITVANFVQYARDGFYDNTLFHRVVRRFVIQTGGLNTDMSEKETRAPIANESRNGLHNDRHTVAMARTDDPDSATSQFFINLRMNSSLDAQRGQPGYTVFAEVVDGFHVVDDIGKVAVGKVAGYGDVPLQPIVLQSVELLPAASQ